MWYAIQVTTGKEAATAELVEREARPGLVDECFFPGYQTQTKVGGRRVPVTRPLFPGYVLAATDVPDELRRLLPRLSAFARLLCVGGVPTPLADEETSLIDAFTSPGDRCVPMSRGFVEGGRVVVTDGPLVGHEGLIESIDRHKCTACLRLDLCGRRVDARMGLAVLSAPEAPAAHAALARARASHLAAPDPEPSR